MTLLIAQITNLYWDWLIKSHAICLGLEVVQQIFIKEDCLDKDVLVSDKLSQLAPKTQHS